MTVTDMNLPDLDSSLASVSSCYEPLHAHAAASTQRVPLLSP